MNTAPSNAPKGVTLTGVVKWYGKVQAVQGIDLDIRPGEMLSLLGPSGCRKTTTLRMIAGLEEPDAGEIRIGDARANETPPWRRNIGMVFQNYALFPHKNVAENIAYGLVMRRVAKAEIATRVADAMKLVRLDGLGERTPSQLSGGQRQRVALARAIITRPDVLLFSDQPIPAWVSRLGLSVPGEIGLVHLDWSRDVAPLAGLDSDPEAIGVAATDLLVGQLHANEFGIPKHEKIVAVRGHWVPGSSVRRR